MSAVMTLDSETLSYLRRMRDQSKSHEAALIHLGIRFDGGRP
jgi:hypothetical protein